MNINEIAINYIESNSVKDYINSIKHEFSLCEQIALIYNSNLELYNKKYVFEYMLNNCDIAEDIRKELEIIVCNINILFDKLDSNDYVLLIYDSDKEPIILRNLTKLKEYLKNNSECKLYDNKAYLVGIDKSNIIYEIHINRSFELIKFFNCSDDDYRNSTIQDSYVNIPNEFKIGDIVKTTYNDEEYIVVCDSKIPEHLIEKCEFEDSSLTVIPKNTLCGSDNYLEQIEKVIKDRINEIGTEIDTQDIIWEEHEHILVTNVEKI